MNTPTPRPTLEVMSTAIGVVDTLGPGRRAVVWVQGCSLHCRGCIVPESWARGRGQTVDPEALAHQLLAGDPTSDLTVSGGEPTEQPEAVALLLAAARRMSRTTWLYTGRTLAELRADPRPAIAELLAQVDVLVDGRYEVSQAQALGYRGSANQQIIRLTEAISSKDAHGGQPGKVEVTISDGHLNVIGVPAPGFLSQLREGLARRGVIVDPTNQW